MNEMTSGSALRPMEVGLVLQGGGALGAYEYGGILGLLDLIDEAEQGGRSVTLKAVTGVSIGAINAACLVGADSRGDARERLKALWQDFTIDMLPFLPSALSNNVALWYVPHFYSFEPSWTHLYNTHDLVRTLKDHVNFKALNESATTFAVTAADIVSGELVRFTNKPLGDTKPTTIGPEHVLASGSLPPQFPWTAIGDGADRHFYWDGGVIDNTPLGDAVDAFTSAADVDRLIVVMNLFPLQAKLPNSFAEVNDRVNQMRFGNRLRQDVGNARQINALIATIDELLPFAPQDVQDRVRKKYGDYKLVNPIEISLSADTDYAEQDAFRDFSREGVEKRRDAGRNLTLAKLRPLFAGQPAASS
jgi:predicted acylesterase/phospholipase RssA